MSRSDIFSGGPAICVLFATQDFSGQGFDVLANGTPIVLSGTPGFWNYSPTGAIYNQLTGVFTALATTTTISIVGRPFGSTVFMIGLDDVSVTGPAAIPVPAALPLFATGLGALGFLAYRRRNRVA